MNTLLHLLEPFTNLLEVWPNPLLKERLKGLTGIFLDRIFDPQTHCFKLFFDRDWNPQGDTVSYGHDIEAAWLIVRAAEVLGDEALLGQARQVSVWVAEAVHKNGCDADGSVFYEGNSAGVYAFEKHWWGQAEGMVGFYDAFQQSADPRWADAALACWQFIDRHMVDRENGDWFKLTSREGQPSLEHFKAGPWECPYHHARACLEMVQRLREAEGRRMRAES